MHSPDIEFDSSIRFIDYNNLKLNIIGVANLGAISGDINIQAGTQAGEAKGFVPTRIGYKTGEPFNINGGLVTCNSYNDAEISTEYSIRDIKYWAIYPYL